MMDPRTFHIASRWLGECIRSHTVCRRINNSRSTHGPSRVIDLNCESPDCLRIRTIETGKSLPYAALSYCWGDNQPEKTTTSNIDERLASFPLQRQPRTIQDAVLVVRQLGFGSIWIDSLCIIQDDPADIVQELGKMHLVYESASLLISAAKASHCDEGILSPAREPLKNHRLPFNCPDGTLSSVLLQRADDGDTWDRIHERMWTMQEHLLSSRVLVYADIGLRWRCDTTSWCDGPWTTRDFTANYVESTLRLESPTWKYLLSTGEDNASSRKYVELTHTPPGLVKPQVSHALMDLAAGRPWPGNHTMEGAYLEAEAIIEWRNLLQGYTQRQVTDPQDRLPAVAALAEKFSQIISCRYVAGHWESVLPSDLFWQAHRISGPPPSRNLTHPFPSWSWASMDAEIEWESPLTSVVTLDVLSVVVELENISLQFGRVASSRLDVSGYIAPVRCVETGEHLESLRGFPQHLTRAGERCALLECSFHALGSIDTSERPYPPVGAILDEPVASVQDIDGCYCLEIFRRHWDESSPFRGNWLPSAGLLLRPQNEQNTSFARVGIFLIGEIGTGDPEWNIDLDHPDLGQEPRSLFEGCPKTAISLV